MIFNGGRSERRALAYELPDRKAPEDVLVEWTPQQNGWIAKFDMVELPGLVVNLAVFNLSSKLSASASRPSSGSGPTGRGSSRRPVAGRNAPRAGSLARRRGRLCLSPAADLPEGELAEVVTGAEDLGVLGGDVLAVGGAGDGEVGVTAVGVGRRAADRRVAEGLDALAGERLHDALLVGLALGLGGLGLAVEDGDSDGHRDPVLDVTDPQQAGAAVGGEDLGEGALRDRGAVGGVGRGA